VKQTRTNEYRCPCPYSRNLSAASSLFCFLFFSLFKKKKLGDKLICFADFVTVSQASLILFLFSLNVFSLKHCNACTTIKGLQRHPTSRSGQSSVGQMHPSKGSTTTSTLQAPQVFFSDFLHSFFNHFLFHRLLRDAFSTFLV
jgi:hypothetical protein